MGYAPYSKLPFWQLCALKGQSAVHTTHIRAYSVNGVVAFSEFVRALVFTVYCFIEFTPVVLDFLA